MTPLSDEILISHIIEQCERICKIVTNIGITEFLENTGYQDAVTRNIEIIGEAANKLSESFEKSHPEIPVSNMVNMRNFLIHQYFRVDPETVWYTCINDILPLYEKLIIISF